jgi:hypothetical protein
MGPRGKALALSAAIGTTLFALAGAAEGQVPGVPPVPILGDPLVSAPEFVGQPAEPRRLRRRLRAPRHPLMAPNGRSNIHNDAYMSDVYRISGPLGDGPEVSTLFARECGSIAFDSEGRIVTICVGLDFPVLALLDPHTLETLAAMPLPPRNSTSPFNDFTGGGYFYLDHRDRAVLPTSARHLLVVSTTGDPGFSVDRDYDLSGRIPSSDAIVSVLPDWAGRIWFVTRGGVVGTVRRSNGAIRTRRLRGEGISNSFAVDETGGVFIVSDQALYRFDARRSGWPRVSWRLRYPDSGKHKPGQVDAGSGTTPTLMGRNLVAITSNADPMHVMVVRRGKRLRGKKRVACRRRVFRRGASATDNTLIATARSIVVENNHGYDQPLAGDELTAPGLTRIDVRKAGRRKRGRLRCRTVWRSAERAPSVVPKLSLRNGLVYTYTKPSRESAWFLTALDFRTGRTVYRRLGGTGFGHNNNYAPITIGPDGTAYVGVLGGLVAFR